MSDPHDATDPAARLKALEARIAAAKGMQDKPKPQAEVHFSQANMAWRMVTELVAGLGIGFGIGYVLDVWVNTRPLFLILFTLLGFAAGVNVMLRTAREIQNEVEAAKTADREGD